MTSPVGGQYVCPMCSEVRETQPGPCPSCGMALEPEVPTLTTTIRYTCPMHPEVVSDEPGDAAEVRSLRRRGFAS